MILKVAYTGNDFDFLKDIEKVVEQYPLVKLEAFCKDKHLTQKDYYKLMNYYATRASKFMVLLDNNLNIIQPFYVFMMLRSVLSLKELPLAFLARII